MLQIKTVSPSASKKTNFVQNKIYKKHFYVAPLVENIIRVKILTQQTASFILYTVKT